MSEELLALQRKVAIKRRLADMSAAPKGREWSDVPMEALTNLPSSLGNLAVNTVQPIIHPINTAKAIGALGSGAYKNVAGGYPANDPDVVAADAVGAMFKQNYGSMEGFKNYVATDPAAAISDLASVLSLGGGLVAKTPGTVGKIGATVGKTASFIDPATNAIRAAKFPVKASGWAARRGADLVNTFTDAGVPKITNRILADRLNKTGIADVAETANTMSNNASPVPGFNRTASQAVTGDAGQTVIESSERQTSRLSGGPSTLMNARLAEQSDALNAAMDVHGKTPEILNAAIAKRAEVTGPLYEAARKSSAPVDANAVMDIAKAAMSENSKRRKVTQPVLRVIENLKTKQGAPLTVRQAMSARDDIKDMLAQRDVAQFPEYDQKVLTDLNRTLDTAITEASPVYKQANKTFAAVSGPINKMQIAQEIKARMTNAKDMDSFNLALADFSNEEKFIEKTTGFTGNKSFSDIFTPKELKEIYAVRDEMQNAFTAKSPRQRTGVEGLKGEIGVEEGFGLNLLSRPVAMANWLAKRLGQDVEPKVAAELIRLHLNPEQMVAALKKGAAPRATNRFSGQLDRIIPDDIGPLLFQSGRAKEQVERNPLVIDVKNRKKP